MIRILTAFLCLPTSLFAGGLTVDAPMVPLAPPGVMAHAAYFTLSNTGDTPRHLIGVTADGYMMAHIHKSEMTDDVATMSSVDLVEITPGKSIAFEPGGLHVMLMRPAAPTEAGDTVQLTLEFANGETIPVSAKVMPMAESHAHEN